MYVAQRRVHDRAVADTAEEVPLREQLVVRGDDGAATHAETLGEGTRRGYGFARHDQSVPDRCTELVGELARQGPGIGAIDGERERDVARSSHREAVPGARFTMSSG